MVSTVSAGNAPPPNAEDEVTELSKQYETPMGLAHTTMQALKDRIKLHYDLASDYYLNLWYVALLRDALPHSRVLSQVYPITTVLILPPVT